MQPPSRPSRRKISFKALDLPKGREWVWFAIPILLGALGYGLSASGFFGSLIVRHSVLTESPFHSWAMGFFGLFVGWSLSLNFRDGGWWGMLGAAYLFGMLPILLLQHYHDYLLETAGLSLALASTAWIAPGALFALNWLTSLYKWRGYISPSGGGRHLWRPGIILSMLILSVFLLKLVGAFDPPEDSDRYLLSLEIFLTYVFAVLAGFFIVLATAVRYEWGDGKSFIFSVNYGVWAPFMILFFLGSTFNLDNLEGVASSKPVQIITVLFITLVIVVLILINALLFIMLFLPNFAKKHELDIPFLRETMRRQEEQKKEKEMERRMSTPPKT